MTCDEFSSRWQERLNAPGSLPSPAELDHLAHCEHCHALSEAGELLSEALTDWRGSNDSWSVQEGDLPAVQRQARLIGRLTTTVVPQANRRNSRIREQRRSRVRVIVASTALLGLAVLALWTRQASEVAPLAALSSGLGEVVPAVALTAGPGSAGPVTVASESTDISTTFPPMALLASARDLVGIGLLPKTQSPPQATGGGASPTSFSTGQPTTQAPAPETLLADLEPIRRGMGRTLDFLWLVSEGNSR
ncbi:MAG: hypothetical protein ACKOJF_13980 [Planctomycetaceae bacterium]